jgi:hypothetical protein
MSEAPHVRYTETKARESAERLHRGALRLILSIVYAMWLVRLDPAIGDRVGSIVADE